MWESDRKREKVHEFASEEERDTKVILLLLLFLLLPPPPTTTKKRKKEEAVCEKIRLISMRVKKVRVCETVRARETYNVSEKDETHVVLK